MGEKKDEKNKKSGGDGEKKKEKMTVILKVDMDCEGCASKIVKCVRGFDGVETVKSDASANKLTVTGTVDPSKIRERLEQKTKKKVDLISPQPKKEKENGNDNSNNKESKPEKKDNKKKTDDKKSDNEKKPKEAPVTTALLKLSLHCHGCIERIHKIVAKTKGVQEVSIDKQKELVTVKGTMNVKSLTESLTERFKRPVTVVPPKKDKEDGDGGEDGGGKKKKGGKQGGGGDGGEESGDGGGKVVEGGKMEYMGQPLYEHGYVHGQGFGPHGYPIQYPLHYPVQYPLHYPAQYPLHYPVQYPVQSHAPQIFSDENPNACSVM